MGNPETVLLDVDVAQLGGIAKAMLMGVYRLIYCVDPIFGNDINDGASWSKPFKTLQRACDRFIIDKASLHNSTSPNYVGPINTTPIDFTGASELYGQHALILLAPGDYGPAANNLPVVNLKQWTADGAVTGGNWGITIASAPGLGRAIIMGSATHLENLIAVNGCRGVTLWNLGFKQFKQNANKADIALYEDIAGTSSCQYVTIEGCHFLQDMVAAAESSPIAINIMGAKFVKIKDNKFHSRKTARGIIIQPSATQNCETVIIEDNDFEALSAGAIQYKAGGSSQNVVIRRNMFRRTGVEVGAGALTMANAIDLDAGLAVQFQPIIQDNDFMGWAKLDATANTDAIYDAQAAATVDAGTDYLGTDAMNRLSS